MKTNRFALLTHVVAAVALLGLSFAHRSPSGGWRVSLVPEVRASITNVFCDYDDPSDGENDDCNTAYQNDVDPKKNRGDPCENGCGNPINFAVGSKFESDTDFEGGGPFPIELKRYYNSTDDGLLKEFGLKWRGSYHRSINQTDPQTVYITRDNGKVFIFRNVSGVWKPDADVNYTLTLGVARWTLRTDQDDYEIYSLDGRLVTFRDRTGLSQSIAYDALHRALSVTDPFGRSINFSYVNATSELISQISTPVGNFSYGYDASNRLTQVTYPDGSTKRYLYESAVFPQLLTGVVDQKGVRFATFGYDELGRAVSTEHAGGVERNLVNYGRLSDGLVGVTDPLGAEHYYMMSSIIGSAHRQWIITECATCVHGSERKNVTFDVNGNIHSIEGGGPFNNTVVRTNFEFDLTRNLEKSRTYVPADTAQTPTTITTFWHSNFRLPTQIVEPTKTTKFT